tara:strand:+ start:29241 stop:29501 length:261 start_codon:yes stop_codon:yes gene_type:complete
MKKLNKDKVFYVTGFTTRITNKLHFHSEERECDTICSRNFTFSNVGDNPVEFYEGKFWNNSFAMDDKFICKKCVSVYLLNTETSKA